MHGMIGVTGGIGAGKSTVLEILAGLGHRTLDSDRLVHGFYRPGDPLVERLVRRWGADVGDGAGGIRRDAVARKVFREPVELSWLNEQVHPRVRAAMREEAQSGPGYLFCAVPLLYEVGWERDMYEVWSVWCADSVQKQRLRGRGWDDEQIDRRLNSQFAMDEKLRRADYALINNGSRQGLEQQIRWLLNHLVFS